MAHHQSAEEVEQEHLTAFGRTLGPLYHALHNEMTWLHAKWQQYRKLYAESEKRVDLLNASAAFFFRVVHDVLWEDLLLHIARLTDLPEQGRKKQFKNLTLLRLPEAVADKRSADELRDRTEFARKWRNKRLAHQDLSLAIDVKAAPLPGVSRQYVEEALASFRAIMNRLRVSYLNSEVAYEHFLTHEGADALVDHLAVAARFEEGQTERLRQGKPLPEDLEPPSEA